MTFIFVVVYILMTYFMCFVASPYLLINKVNRSCRLQLTQFIASRCAYPPYLHITNPAHAYLIW